MRWIRLLVKRLALLLRLPVVEYCQRCGKRQYLVWDAPDDLWREITGKEEGVYCPYCFERLARRRAYRFLYWSVRKGLTDE